MAQEELKMDTGKTPNIQGQREFKFDLKEYQESDIMTG